MKTIRIAFLQLLFLRLFLTQFLHSRQSHRLASNRLSSLRCLAQLITKQLLSVGLCPLKWNNDVDHDRVDKNERAIALGGKSPTHYRTTRRGSSESRDGEVKRAKKKEREKKRAREETKYRTVKNNGTYNSTLHCGKTAMFLLQFLCLPAHR